MIIRKATKTDLKEIAVLMKRELSKPPFNEKDIIKSILKSLNFYLREAYIFVILEKKEISGVVVFQIEQWWEGPVIIIQDLVIGNKFQKKGFGKSLMKFVENYSKKEGVRRIYFETNKKSSAVKFYKKIGYKVNKGRISMSKLVK